MKVGGLADVTTSLPKALAGLGHDVRLLIPAYGCLQGRGPAGPGIGLSVQVPEGVKAASLATTSLDWGLAVYLLQSHEYFDGPDVYGPNDLQRFDFFSRAIPECLRKMDWSPDLVHCHDWHTGLVPALLKKDGRGPCVFTIHNLAYQGQFDENYLGTHRLGEYIAPPPGGVPAPLSMMAIGIAWADRITTVSETYAREILTPEYGVGLDPLLNSRRDRLQGIVNGLDYEEYDPANDPRIPVRYDISSVGKKAGNKLALQRAFSLPVDTGIPLIGMVQRLDEQKGFDIFAPSIAHILNESSAQVVIVGQGREHYEAMLRDIAASYPARIGLHIGYSDSLSRQTYAGSDMFLMPSRFEPCGLGQLIAMRYGSLPIVRLTGGLVDTVADLSDDLVSGSGFAFDQYSAEALCAAVKRAVTAFQDRAAWTAAVKRVMALDFSWAASARKYEQLYLGLLPAERAGS